MLRSSSVNPAILLWRDTFWLRGLDINSARIRSIVYPTLLNPRCPNQECSSFKDHSKSQIAPHGFFKTKAGKRRRFRCQSCRTSFSSVKRTPYFRIQHPHSKLDQVASMSVDGVSKSSISRVQSIAWKTVPRWREKASLSCRQFNRHTTIPRCVQLPCPSASIQDFRITIPIEGQSHPFCFQC